MPSAEEVRQFKNFDALLEAYQKNGKPSSERRSSPFVWTISGLALAASLVGLFFWFNAEETFSKEKYIEQQQAYFESQPFIQPPISEVQPTFVTQKVNTSEGGILEYANQTKLIVPEQAFVDENGQLVEGEVKVFYKEMQDPIDFFLSGIPLTYDSAGVTYLLESAGMIEVYAMQDEKQVRLRQDKTIDVQLVSEITRPNLTTFPSFNIYKLDEANRAWIYQAVDDLSFHTNNSEAISAIEALALSEADALKKVAQQFPLPSKPIEPQAQNKNLPSFDLTGLVDTAYKSVVWQLTPDSPAPPETTNLLDAQIFPLENGKYRIALVHKDGTSNIIATKVLLDDEYESALMNYEKALVTYEKQLNQRDSLVEAQKRQIIQSFEKSRVLLKNQQNVQIGNVRKVVNSFKINSLGIWNCDRPVLPATQQAVVAFEDQFGHRFKHTTAYLWDKSLNTIQRFYVGEQTLLKYNTNTVNMLWIVSKQNQVALLRPEKFKQINPAAKAQVIELDLIEEALDTEIKIRQIVKL